MRTIVLFLLTAALAIPGPARMGTAGASPPNTGNSSIGTGITLGGVAGGVADPLTTKTITIRDALNQPVAGATVVLDFSACVNGGDIHLCADQPDPGVTLDCALHQISVVTDVHGNATFRVVGFALNPGGGVFGAPAPGFGAGGVTVRAPDGVLGTLIVSAFDQDGQLGANTTDLARFLNDDFSFNVGNSVATERGRSDYNADGKVNVVDLSFFIRARFAGGSTESCVSACP